MWNSNEYAQYFLSASLDTRYVLICIQRFLSENIICDIFTGDQGSHPVPLGCPVIGKGTSDKGIAS